MTPKQHRISGGIRMPESPRAGERFPDNNMGEPQAFSNWRNSDGVLEDHSEAPASTV